MLKNKFSGKKILIAVPDFVGFPEAFKLGLETLGFNVYLLRNYEYSEIGVKYSLVHVYKKLAYGIKTFKKEKRKQLDYFKQLKEFKQFNVDHFDFALFIRPDLFSIELIELVKSKAEKIVAYQWDGLDVYPEVYNRIELFDSFFVFDTNDLKSNKKLLPLTNFYFPNIYVKETSIDVYFVGYYKEDRIENLLLLARKFKELNLKTAINICVNSTKQISKLKGEPINIITKQVPLIENIINISKSRIVIDVANVAHCGLSMRSFEALGYEKKMITNNILIKKYDFYHPNNIFVIENENFDGLDKFILLPYKKLPNEIMEKYSFSNWLKYIFDLPTYMPIDFPK